MLRKIFSNPVIIFFIFVFLVVALIYALFPETFRPTEDARLKDVLNCKVDRLSPNLLSSRLGDEKLPRLIISMHQKPDEVTISEFASQQITLFPSTWIFDYLIGETTDYESLCFLAEDDRVSYVDIAP